jgi:biopolymer transport protein TolQ
MQLGRLITAQRRFEKACNLAHNAEELLELASQNRSAPGATVVRAIGARLEDDLVSTDLLTAVAKRAITTEEQRSAVLMPTLSSIASSSPFIGLFGTVWGIMIAFQRIGAEKSASLPVVAPAIGEALVATAFGLFAAIPATIGYNYVDRKIADLMDELNASADVWVARMYASERHARQNSSAGRKLGA